MFPKKSNFSKKSKVTLGSHLVGHPDTHVLHILLFPVKSNHLTIRVSKKNYFTKKSKMAPNGHLVGHPDTHVTHTNIFPVESKHLTVKVSKKI